MTQPQDGIVRHDPTAEPLAACTATKLTKTPSPRPLRRTAHVAWLIENSELSLNPKPQTASQLLEVEFSCRCRSRRTEPIIFTPVYVTPQPPRKDRKVTAKRVSGFGTPHNRSFQPVHSEFPNQRKATSQNQSISSIARREILLLSRLISRNIQRSGCRHSMQTCTLVVL